MNKIKNKKSLILKTIGSVAGIASTTLLLSPSFVQEVLINKDSIKNQDLNRSLNENSRESMTNSEFYFSSFSFLNPDQGEETLAQLPAAKTQWERIRANLLTYSRFSGTPSYQYIMQKIDDLFAWEVNLIVREALRTSNQMDLWETVIKDQLGWKEFVDVAGTQEELDKNIKTLSGFVYGSSSNYRIRTLENKMALKVDLDTGATTKVDLIGEYKTVITIAEIDPATLNQDIKIDFNFSSTAFSAITAQGSLIIRNKNNQISTPTLQESLDNLEIFGRWTNLGNNVVGNNNFKQFMDNFVLSKTPEGKILVVARLKDGDQLSNIRVDGVPSFGIINSQIDSTSIYPTDHMITNIRFFSTNLLMSNATSADVSGAINTKINKKYEFYIGDDTEFNLNLFYKNVNGDSSYKELFAFENDVVSSVNKQTLNVGIVEGAPSNISNRNIEFSDEVIAELGYDGLNLEDLSISLKTEKSESQNLFKQGIYLNDLLGFAIFGSPIPSATGITISLGDRITEKIFFEDPGFVASATPSVEVSSANAVKWVNSENQVITELARIYDAWSKEGTIGSTKLGSKLYNKISYEKVGDTYKNITWRNQSNDYSGSEIYQTLVEEYNVYQDILQQLIPSTNVVRNIFEIGPGGTAQNIVKNTLLSIENKAQRTIIIENVRLIIEGTSPNKNLLIEEQLAELIRIKFSEMKDTLTNPINSFYYNEVKKYLETELTDLNKIANVDTFLKFDMENGLFNLTSQNPTILETQTSLTGADKMKSLFDLLYFGSKSYGFETTFFGTSIFSAISNSGGTESILNLFVGFSSNQNSLVNFTSSVSKTQVDTINIYDRLLSTFGFGINEITENSLKTGAQIELNWNGVNLESAINQIFNKFNLSVNETVKILEINYEYNMLNSLITSSNIYNSLIFRRNNPPEGLASIENDAKRISEILDSGIISPENIFTWSRIQKVGNDINLYTTYFSKNEAETLKLSNEIKTELDILDRFVEEQHALFQINPFFDVQVVWPILVGLIAVGMIVVSSMSLAGTRKYSKLTSKPIVKVMLVISIAISVMALGLIGGLVIPGLII